ncbi:deoxyuridine 5'-triphosphate nucleotidohydrolase-like [Hydra vulgaris]|uniref:Deoxyuridine 5'-triphosphate nucleotidohydrolase n=1 Tax=Hydra vulgaris TaxID=6087 RepID=A0ABM4DMD1_HYDVU
MDDESYFTLNNSTLAGNDMFYAADPSQCSDQDLCLLNDVLLIPGVPTKCSTGVIVQPPLGYFTTVMSRSSLFMKNVTLFSGIIDSDFTRPIQICLRNEDKHSEFLCKTLAVAQLTMVKYNNCRFNQTEKMSIRVTQRGDQGFGSTNAIKCESLSSNVNTF